MKLLFIGDVVGTGGRELLKDVLPALKQREAIDVCVANAENAAAGMGLTEKVARQIHACGVDVLTLGNHTWARQDLLAHIDQLPFVVRPANGPPAWPGQGSVVFWVKGVPLLVLNLLGRIFMRMIEDPFREADRQIDAFRRQHPNGLVLVDFHAEATSEKVAMGWYLDGRATAVLGTHTHVQTADERLLPQKTAYITDVGMTGPTNGVIGMDLDSSLRRLIDQLPSRYQLATGPCALCGVIVEADPATGQARSIRRLRLEE